MASGAQGRVSACPTPALSPCHRCVCSTSTMPGHEVLPTYLQKESFCFNPTPLAGTSFPGSWHHLFGNMPYDKRPTTWPFCFKVYILKNKKKTFWFLPWGLFLFSVPFHSR